MLNLRDISLETLNPNQFPVKQRTKGSPERGAVSEAD
jgi:hypothetical protein